jgi:flagellar motility protein MotE (MotC chaperone)
MRRHAFKPQTNPNQQKCPLLESSKSNKKKKPQSKRRKDTDEIFQHRCSSQKYLQKKESQNEREKVTQKTKKRKEKTNPHPSARIDFQSLRNKHG